MSGNNGMGPMGQGALTGRGMGNCRTGGGRGMGRRNQSQNCGMGMGARKRRHGFTNDSVGVTKEEMAQEINTLKEEIVRIERLLNQD